MNATDVTAARTAARGQPPSTASAPSRPRTASPARRLRRSGRAAEARRAGAPVPLAPTSRRRPTARRASNRYLLQEDPGNRFALYLNALNPGNETKPHDHTTWAVVVAVDGQELNKVYERTDDGADPETLRDCACARRSWSSPAAASA